MEEKQSILDIFRYDFIGSLQRLPMRQYLLSLIKSLSMTDGIEVIGRESTFSILWIVIF
jgi:hypothetical protein